MNVRLIAYEVLDSTNAEALRLARHGEQGPLWIAARRQTAGRGRRGRAWTSEPGNLFASLLLASPGRAEHWPQLSFVAALALHDAVGDIAGRLAPDLRIKWPNDLLLRGAKFAGVLIEADGDGAVVIGIGVNCASHPSGTDYPATSLAELAVSAEALMSRLPARMLERLAQWDLGAGFSATRAAWLARAAGLGEDLRVRLDDHELFGRFESLDAAGGLLLRLPTGGLTTIAAGDVFPAAAAARAIAC